MVRKAVCFFVEMLYYSIKLQYLTHHICQADEVSKVKWLQHSGRVNHFGLGVEFGMPVTTANDLAIQKLSHNAWS